VDFEPEFIYIKIVGTFLVQHINAGMCHFGDHDKYFYKDGRSFLSPALENCYFIEEGPEQPLCNPEADINCKPDMPGPPGKDRNI